MTLSGLLVFPQDFLKSVAYGAIAAVILAAALSVTLLPAVLMLLGHRVDALGIKRMQRHRTREEVENGLFGRVADFSMKRPVAVAIPVVVVLVALIIPFSGVKFGGINETYLPPNHDTRVAQDTFNDEFPAFRTEPVKLVVEGATNEQLVDVVMQVRGLDGLDRLAPALVGPADDGRFEHRIVRHDRLFDLDGRDVLPARDDDVFLAIFDLDIPVGVHHADIAGVKPAAVKSRLGFLGLLPIAVHDDVGSGEYLPGTLVGVLGT